MEGTACGGGQGEAHRTIGARTAVLAHVLARPAVASRARPRRARMHTNFSCGRQQRADEDKSDMRDGATKPRRGISFLGVGEKKNGVATRCDAMRGACVRANLACACAAQLGPGDICRVRAGGVLFARKWSTRYIAAQIDQWHGSHRRRAVRMVSAAGTRKLRHHEDYNLSRIKEDPPV